MFHGENAPKGGTRSARKPLLTATPRTWTGPRSLLALHRGRLWRERAPLTSTARPVASRGRGRAGRRRTLDAPDARNARKACPRRSNAARRAEGRRVDATDEGTPAARSSSKTGGRSPVAVAGAARAPRPGSTGEASRTWRERREDATDARTHGPEVNRCTHGDFAEAQPPPEGPLRPVAAPSRLRRRRPWDAREGARRRDGAAVAPPAGASPLHGRETARTVARGAAERGDADGETRKGRDGAGRDRRRRGRSVAARGARCRGAAVARMLGLSNLGKIWG